MFTFGVVSLAALLAIWIGYPVVVRVLATLRRSPTVGGRGETPTVSVILASHDEAAAIEERVRDLLAGDYPADRLEVVVALDAARARTTPAALAHLGPSVRVLAGDAPGGKASSLNAAVRASHSDILVFTDTAQRFDRQAIPALVAALGDPAFGAASGSLDIGTAGKSINLAERYWRYEKWLRFWESRLHSCVGVTGAIYAMRRELWEPLPAGLILDDVFTPMRLVQQGWRVGFTDAARAHDARRFAAGDEYRRKVRTLTGVIQLCVWLPGVMNPLRNPIWLQFVFHKLLRLLTPYLTLFVAIAAVWLATAALLASPAGTRALPVAVLGGGLLLLVPRVRRIVRAQLAWGMALQSSVVVATINGVRGRWDVWQ
jgi:cellulose synthase/poly-beta-1,6-N-acetylglucosamine synthase-like glycosyltransferase